MEEIQSLVDISHIVPPMKMGKPPPAAIAIISGYTFRSARGIRFDQYSRIWHER